MMGAEVRRVSDSIICVRRASYLTCSYIVKTKRGLVLVDAGMASDGADVDAGLDFMNARHADVRAILLTHWHNDHTAGAEITRQRSGAPVFYHRGDEAFYTGRGHREPVTADVPGAIEAMRRHLDAGGNWPLLG